MQRLLFAWDDLKWSPLGQERVAGDVLFWWQKRTGKVRRALRGKFLLTASAQGRSAGPEAGRGVPTPPSLPLDSTHPATGQGLLALDNPKEEVEAQKS